MPSSRISRRQSSWLRLGLISLGCIVVLAALTPWLRSVHKSFLDNQVEQASAAAGRGDYANAEAILQRINWVAFGDRRPLRLLGEYYARQGNYPAAIAAYQQLPFRDGYALTGQTALAAQNYTLAEDTYRQAVQKFATPANFAQLALADYNLNKINTGCNNAKNALKAGLDNPAAQQSDALCLILNNQVPQAQHQYPELTSALDGSQRAGIYYLLQHGVITVGESMLDKLATKTPGDWLTLSQLAAARGDIATAHDRAEQGIKLDITNVPLYQALIQYDRYLGKTDELKTYQTRLQQLSQK